MRKQIVAGNWKMNMTKEEGQALISEVVNMAKDEVKANTILVLCTPAPHLGYAKRMFQSQANVFLGAQDCHEKASGAYTGEISAPILKSFEVDYVILGHSERREYFKESDELLKAKTDQALANNLIPIFCCGESLSQRQAGSGFIEFVCGQITNSLFHLSAEQFAKVVIAYEPIWAIGTGLTASSEQAQEMHAALRKHIASKYGELANEISILYGGSAKPSNAPELFACPDVDGGLIGGASLKSRDFIDIAKALK
ncbi:MAG: triose-phosphate isomerase [Cytophagales bacterium]|nr:MAG: triose-phosphate isomerase [Cytophagales bacterium]